MVQRIFIDANVIITVLNKEYPRFSSAARVLSLADRRDFELVTSSICLAISFYFAEKKHGSEKAKQKIGLLSKHIRVINTGAEEVNSTLSDKQIIDFEDGLEYHSALNAGCSIIVTEDQSDFYFSSILVVGCDDLLMKISSHYT
jgi:predicted nucleic acid-binding protein